jgi:ribosomal-protein-alanine N-acetyltransferase
MTENILTTERLSMRPFSESDLDWLVGHRSSEDVSKFLGGLELQTPAFVLKRLRFYMDCFERLGFSMCLTTLKETGEPIGVTGIQPLEKTGNIEVGYSFEREFWGKGLATEAAAAWMEFGFEVGGLERIVAVAEPENRGSTKVMEKLGMTFEKTSISYNLQVVQYAVSKEDFFKHRQGK